MRIIHPKPIRKAAHIRRAELAERLQLAFVVIAALVAFAMILRALPYILTIYDNPATLSDFTTQKLSTYEQEKTTHLWQRLYGNK